jgi:hypothetical protein
MAQHPPRTGVCLVRIEAQDTCFLITVRRVPDIGRPADDIVDHFSEVEPTLIAVRSFLERFTAHASAS